MRIEDEKHPTDRPIRAVRPHIEGEQHRVMPTGSTEDAPLELAAVQFDHETSAASRYQDARERAGAAPWTANIGFVERHHNGRLLMRGVFAGHYVYVDESDRVSQPGAAEGGAAGGVLGALAGPPGIAVGLTLGAIVGARVGRTSDFELEPHALVERLREIVPPSSSAIVAIAPAPEIDEMLSALADGADYEFRRALSPGERAALELSLASAPAVMHATPAARRAREFGRPGSE